MTSTTDRSVAARIVDLLAAEGIDTIFGIPDPNFQRMYRVAADRGMRLVAPHHESAGGFMADAMWRLTGRAQVVIGNQGPGVANLVPAAICASKEKAPIVFIAGQRGRLLDSQVRRSKFQYTPQPKFFEAAMKYVGIIEFASQVDEVLHEAFRQALSGTPGPVYVEFPSEHANAEIDLGPVARPQDYRLMHQQAAPDAVDAAADLLIGAASPLVLVGCGVRNSRAFASLDQLIAALKCPVIPSWAARGVVPDTHPNVLLYSSPAANEAIAAADVVLALGTAIGENLHYGVGHHWAHGHTERKWIYVEREPGNIGVNRRIDVPLVGDVRDVMPQLAAALARRGNRAPLPALPAWRAAHQTARKALWDSAGDVEPIHPGRMIREVTALLPDDAVVVRDGGATALTEVHYHEMRSRDQLSTLHFGHLGTGLPYALGAQLAVGPGRRVCLITGDSAFLFHIAELETAVRKQLPVVIIVNSDSAWGMERPGFYQEFGQGREVEVDWGKIRLDKIAEGFGAHGEYVQQTRDIRGAVERAFAAGKPAVVQVVVDPLINALQMPNVQEFVTWYAGSLY
jgi:thiamine pyrophosphate-dependent acetolactate synthase large subunit-like protein